MADLKGITIKFRGDDTEFLSAVKKVNGEIRQTKSEISLLNKQLKFDPKNVELLTKKFDLLKKREKELTEQTQVLDEGLKSIDPNSREWTMYNNQLQRATAELNNIRQELSNMPSPNIEALSKSFEEWGNKLEDIGGKIENVGKKLSVLSAGIIGLGTAGIKYNAQMEQYQTAYTTLIGDAEKANQTIQQIQESASRTPFSTESLIEANQYLISAGVEAEESQEFILALGDAISAVGGGSAELSRMAQNLQQIKNVGKASAQDIKQFANAGINIYGLLADTTGKTVEELQDMDITYDDLLKSFKTASSEGGKYFGAMETQSQTLNGSISSLKDQISQLLGELTAEFLPVIKEILQNIRDFITSIKEMSPAQKKMITNIATVLALLGPTVTMIGKTVSVLGSASKGISTVIKNIDNVKKVISSMWGIVTNVFSTLGGFISAHPVVTAIVGLIAVFTILYTRCESFRNAVNNIINAMKNMWNYFKQTNWIQALGDKFGWLGTVIGGVVEKIKTIVNWFGNAITKAKEFLGINGGNILPSGGGFGGATPVINSGGFSSGGMMAGSLTLNNTFTVNSNNITESQVRSWADLITEQVNENLGRMV